MAILLDLQMAAFRSGGAGRQFSLNRCHLQVRRERRAAELDLRVATQRNAHNIY